MLLMLSTILQYEQLPEISTRIILFIKNLNEHFSAGCVQGNTYTVVKKKKKKKDNYFRAHLKEEMLQW